MDKNIVISLKTIAITFLAILAGYIIYRLGPVFAVLVIAGLLVLALEPLVRWFMRHNLFRRPISRSFAVILTYAIFVASVLIIFTIGLPPVINQAQKLIVYLSNLLLSLNLTESKELSIQRLLPQLSNISGGVFGAVSSGFSTITTAFSLLMISIYMSLDWENLKRRFIALFPDKNKLDISRMIEEIEQNVGQWVKGQTALMVIIGSISFAGLVVLQVPYPLALGLIAGLLEAVPILGPVISAVLAAVIAFADTPVKGLAVLILFTVIQQLENNILVPKVMQKVSGFSPLAILIALLIGSNFFGIIGAIMAVPFTMVAVIIVKSLLKYEKRLMK